MQEIIVLRVVHVLGGLFWVGSALFNSIYLFPAMASAGAAAGAIMGSMRQRHLFIVLPGIALLTILSGVRLMWITSADFSAAYFESGRGATFAWGGTFAIVAFLLGVLIGRPTGMRMGKVQQALANAPDDETRGELAGQLARLNRRGMVVGWTANVLLILAASFMAAARYVV
jgi:uncharacterized membrane protein